MARGLGRKPLKGRNFALTILLGIFIAIMLISLVNLSVDYVYPSPQYEEFCNGALDRGILPYPAEIKGTDCTFNKVVQDAAQECLNDGGTPIYEYDDAGCVVLLSECNDCQNRYDATMKVYNRNGFFIFAVIGFLLIVSGLFVSPLLVQLALLPSGAILVIEAAMRNFDSKLSTIIVLALLIVAAVYLALKKLK